MREKEKGKIKKTLLSYATNSQRTALYTANPLLLLLIEIGG